MAYPIRIDTITKSIKDIITKRCTIKIKKTIYEKEDIDIVCYSVNKTEGNVYVPLCLRKELGLPFTTRYTLRNITFRGKLYTTSTDPKGYRDQEDISKEAMKMLSTSNVVFLELPCGFGKTTLGVHISSMIKHRICVLCYYKIVRDQWKETFEKLSDAKVQLITGDTKPSKEYDVYIIGVNKASKLSRDLLRDVGTLIVDEAHRSPSTIFSTSILKFQPKYVIGMSATPDVRQSNDVLRLYFQDNFIHRSERKSFTVVKYDTLYRPDIRYRKVFGKSRLDWTHAISSLAYNNDRQNDIILDIIVPNIGKYKILLLSDRSEECKELHLKLSSQDIKSILLIGTMKRDQDLIDKCDVLIAGEKKVGVGFDDPSFNMLILCTDKMDVRQYEGRLRSTDCVIYDIVDDNDTLRNHWDTRREWYLSRGATIVMYKDTLK